MVCPMQKIDFQKEKVNLKGNVMEYDNFIWDISSIFL